MSIKQTATAPTKAIASMRANMEKKAVEMQQRALSMSFFATYSATLLRTPLPMPRSILSIHSRSDTTIIHRPLLYVPRQRSVTGTSNSCTTPAHPFMTKDATTFLFMRPDLVFASDIYINSEIKKLFINPHLAGSYRPDQGSAPHYAP